MVMFEEDIWVSKDMGVDPIGPRVSYMYKTLEPPPLSSTQQKESGVITDSIVDADPHWF